MLRAFISSPPPSTSSWQAIFLHAFSACSLCAAAHYVWMRRYSIKTFSYMAKIALRGLAAGPVSAKPVSMDSTGMPRNEVRALTLSEARAAAPSSIGSSFFTLSNFLTNRNWRHLLWLEWNRVVNVSQYPHNDDFLYAGGVLAHVKTLKQADEQLQQKNLKHQMAKMDEEFSKVGVPVKHLVLVGGGHSHVHVLKMLAMQPLKNTRVTLVSKDVATPYSGMMPGHVGGLYSKAEAHLDLFRLARFARVRFVVGEVEKIDFEKKEVVLCSNGGLGMDEADVEYEMGERSSSPDGEIKRMPMSSTRAGANTATARPAIGFDVISVNVGSVPDKPPQFADPALEVTAVKPIDGLSASWETILNRIETEIVNNKAQKKDHYLPETPLRICLVGGGAAGVELTFAIRQKLIVEKNCGGFVEVCLVHHGGELLGAHHGEPARKLVLELLEEKGVKVYLNSPVVGAEMKHQDGDDASLQKQKFLVTSTSPDTAASSSNANPKNSTENGDENTRRKIPFDYCIWCTGGLPPRFLVDSLRAARLRTDTSDGSLLVNTHMQSVSNPDVFGAGDCVTIENHKRPKAGVFAVMAGMVLFNNLKKHVEASATSTSSGTSTSSSPKPKLEHYFPQTEWLGLLNLCDGTAMASRGDNLAVRGAWLWQLKDFIDRKWMGQYGGRGLPRMLPPIPVDARPSSGRDVGSSEKPKIFSSQQLLSGETSLVHIAADTPALGTSEARIKLYLELQGRATEDPNMRCGGCACKLGGKVLAKGLSGGNVVGLTPSAEEDVSDYDRTRW